jgi:hypothetical protein
VLAWATTVGFVDADVGHDLVEPGRQAPVVAHASTGAIGAGEGLLHGVLSRRVVGETTQGVTVEGGSVGANERLEGLVLAGSEGLDETRIVD